MSDSSKQSGNEGAHNESKRIAITVSKLEWEALSLDAKRERMSLSRFAASALRRGLSKSHSRHQNSIDQIIILHNILDALNRVAHFASSSMSFGDRLAIFGYLYQIQQLLLSPDPLARKELAENLGEGI